MRKILALVFICAGCLEPYAPPASIGNVNALVVDGFIDAGGSASVTLSRTVPLDASMLSAPKETGAIISIESSGGEIFPLHETDTATYTINGLTVDKTATYTLHIVTTDQHDYRSDAMRVLGTPPIDSVYHTISPTNQVEIRVDSHVADPNGSSHYAFSGIESYEYHAAIYTPYKYVNHMPVERLPEEDVFTCYKDERTPGTVASTQDLSENRLSGVIVSTINRTSEKISNRYSILVKQRAISVEEYTFQQRLIATTEQTGGIFAPIPGAVTGNIRSTKHPDETVLGYFRAQEIKELRYFIDAYHNPLPEAFYQKIPSTCGSESTCFLPGIDSVYNFSCTDYSALSDGIGVLNIIRGVDGNPTRYIFVVGECTNCTYKGGTTKKPAFWQ